MRIIPVLLLPIFAACTPGVTVEKHNRDLNQLYGRINKLEEEKNVSLVKMNATNNKILILEGQLAKLQKKLNELNAAPVATRTTARVNPPIENSSEATALRSEIEQYLKRREKHQGGPEREVEEPIILNDSMLNKRKEKAVLEELKTPSQKTPSPREVKPLPRKVARIKRFSRRALKRDYDAALALYRVKKYSESKDAFEAMVVKYRKFPTSLSDNFYYWIGENYLSLKDIPLARFNFNQVLRKYPRANKVPDALFKLGMILELEKKTENAIKYYRQVVQNHPNTEAARESAERLQILKQ